MDTTGDTTQFPTLDRQTDPRFFIQYLDAGNVLEDVKRLKQVMIAETQHRHAASGLSVAFVVGNARHLWFADASFDRQALSPSV
jgi:hypothetical protein